MPLLRKVIISTPCFLRCECRTNPRFDSLRVNVHPIIGPIDRFRIPIEPLEIFTRQHARSFADIACFENETVMEHEGQKFVECDFLRPNLAACVAQALQKWVDSARTQERLSQGQCSVDHIKSALYSCAAS